MKFSPFNPIFFHKDGIAQNGAMSGYIHTYAVSDYIVFEVLHSYSEVLEPLALKDYATGETIMELSWLLYHINETDCVSFYELRGLAPGCYKLSFGEWSSNPILITDDADILKDTILIQYAQSANDMRQDVYQTIKGRLRYFEIRLPGGFKDNGWQFSVESEQFTTDKGDIVALGALEATDKTLTVGTSDGVPVLVGEILNHILACRLIFIDGERYSPADSKGVESVPCMENGNRFVYSITLRAASFINATFERKLRSLFRKVPGNLRKVNRNLRKI